MNYSGTSEIRTPRDLAKGPHFGGVLNTEVSL